MRDYLVAALGLRPELSIVALALVALALTAAKTLSKDDGSSVSTCRRKMTAGGSSSSSSTAAKKRSYQEECQYIERRTAVEYRIQPGFAPNMRVPGVLYVNSSLEKLIFTELLNYSKQSDRGTQGG